MTRANGEVSLLPSGSPKTILEEVRHLLDHDIAENVAILVRTNREADDCERLVCRLGYRTFPARMRCLADGWALIAKRRCGSSMWP